MSVPVNQDVQRFHDECLVFLAYTVTPIHLTRTGASLSHMTEWLDGPQVDLPKLKAGGVDALFLSVGSDSVISEPTATRVWATQPPKTGLRPVFSGPAEVKRILWGIDALHRMIENNNQAIELALSASDVERIVARGKIAGIIHITRGAIDDDLAVLRTYHRLGVRAMQIAYDDGSPTWVDGCNSAPNANGLSDFGRQVVREMNRLGILIDLAHASDRAYADVIVASEKPVISSHSGARALCNVWRNLNDDTMRQLAAHGGMLGAYFCSDYLDESFLAQESATAFRDNVVRRHLELAQRYRDDPWALAAALREPVPSPAEDAPAKTISPIEILLDHIDYSIGIVGEDNFCLGSDFGGIDDEGVTGLAEPSKMANLTDALLARGYHKETVRKILGTNLLRFFRVVAGD